MFYGAALTMGDDINRFRKRKEYNFLLGLKWDLDEVHRRILSIKPLPSVREVF